MSRSSTWVRAHGGASRLLFLSPPLRWLRALAHLRFDSNCFPCADRNLRECLSLSLFHRVTTSQMNASPPSSAASRVYLNMSTALRYNAASGFRAVLAVASQWSRVPRASALRRAAWLALSFFAFVAFSIFAFSRNYADLAYGTDGVFTFLLAIHAWNWAPVGLGFGPYPIEGMSDIWCCENPFLLPGHLLYALIFGKPAEYTATYVIAGYTIFAAELFLSVVVLARALGMPWLIAVVSAWILSLLAWPYFGFSFLYPILMTAPTVGTTISEPALLLAAVAYLVRSRGDGLRRRVLARR
jgi:hypothetical protein